MLAAAVILITLGRPYTGQPLDDKSTLQEKLGSSTYLQYLLDSFPHVTEGMIDLMVEPGAEGNCEGFAITGKLGKILNPGYWDECIRSNSGEFIVFSQNENADAYVPNLEFSLDIFYDQQQIYEPMKQFLIDEEVATEVYTEYAAPELCLNTDPTSKYFKAPTFAMTEDQVNTLFGKIFKFRVIGKTTEVVYMKPFIGDIIRNDLTDACKRVLRTWYVMKNKYFKFAKNCAAGFNVLIEVLMNAENRLRYEHIGQAKDDGSTVLLTHKLADEGPVVRFRLTDIYNQLTLEGSIFYKSWKRCTFSNPVPKSNPRSAPIPKSARGSGSKQVINPVPKPTEAKTYLKSARQMPKLVASNSVTQRKTNPAPLAYPKPVINPKTKLLVLGTPI